MNEVSTPLGTQPRADARLSQILVDNAHSHPDRPAIARRRPDGTWDDLTSADFLREVRALAKGIIAAGIAPGSAIGLMSRTRYEWTLIDFAIWTAGCVSVPVYETSSASQVRWMLSDSAAVAIFVEQADHAATVTSIRDELPGLTHVWQIGNGNLDELVAAGAEVSDADLDARVADVTGDSVATIIYTSGTTGRPKGCELTHGNFRWLSDSAARKLTEIVDTPGATMLMFLPLAHVLARYIQVLGVAEGVRIGHVPDVATLLPDLASLRPTFLLAVPRVFEKIYNASDQKAAAEGRGKIFRAAAKTATEYSQALDTGGPSLSLRLRHKAMDLLVYGKIRSAMGGQVTYAVSGGGPLGPRLGHFFRGVGVNVLEGYGLTETTAPTNVNLPAMTKIGTVGPPLPGVSVRTHEGEIQVKGLGVFRRYHNNDEATAAAFTEDGWFRTGDLGSIDEDGCLTITGRTKEILVTAGGKNVSPAPLEDAIRAHPLVSQCLVVGDGRPFVAALISLDPDMLPGWCKAQGVPELSMEEARTSEEVRRSLQEAVEAANTTVSRPESIRRFEIIDTDFTEESGHLTPSLKLKRNKITEDFADRIDELYARSREERDSARG